MASSKSGPAEARSVPTPGAADDVLRLDRQFCFALYSASAAVTRVYRPLLEPLGLTYPQYLVMLVLWENAPKSVGQIGAALNLDSATLTPLLKRLEANGLISRRRDATDERRLVVALTPAGLALRDQALKVPEQLLCRVGLPLDELAAMHRTLTKLAAASRDVEQ